MLKSENLAYQQGTNMDYNTSELCDLFADNVDVVDPIFTSYGGRYSFGGEITTVKCFEDSSSGPASSSSARQVRATWWIATDRGSADEILTS